MRTTSSYIAPRRRHRRPLGACEITRHAVEAYIQRVDQEASYDAALTAIEQAATTAYKVGKTWTDGEIYQADGFRLVAVKPARRLPIVVTVLPPLGARS